MTAARLFGARKSAGNLTAGEERNGRAGIAAAEQASALLDVSRPDIRAPWLDPQRGRKRPHRPRLDELDRR